jgi:NAD(P)-dependent dehydrogenase (short-subunit alcohol dehydrogenase family)
MKDIYSITGRKAVVIGGGGGIGQAIAKGLAYYGADVAIASRGLDGLKQAANEIETEIGKKVRVFQVDCTEAASIDALANKVLKEMGTIDILVNSQGLNRKNSSIGMPMDVWDAMFAVNVRGMLLCCTAFGKIMIEKTYGRIINISSIRGIRALNGEGNTAYSTTKGAVDMLTKSLAGEWGKFGITVNAIAPIITETKMMKPILEANPMMKEKTAQSAPLGRLGLPDDNIGPAIFLASDASSFVTGQIIYTDGGIAAVC